ncbi:FUSC family protein [uncultured Legionella sp.]|uniref:FUSC family protein n=1 Tax=uncultured Legionella sp. TaxID=210934 RepID=UPI0026267741|nr:FUSC family protein [uncultured Legionella sp.]
MYFGPQSIENRAALRTAIAAVIAVLISFKFHLETPYWSGMSVVIVSNLYTGSIIDKATMRIIGTLAGAFLGFFIAGFVANSFFLYLLCCFLIITISVYFYNYSKYGYAYLLGALCAFIIISQLALNPQNAFFVAVWRPVEIGIGVFVSAISAYVLFPNHIKDNIVVQVHELFDDFLREFKQLQHLLSQPETDFSELADSNLKIKRRVRKAVELVGALNQEIGVKPETVDEVRAYLDSFYAISRQLQYLLIITPQSDDLAALKLLNINTVFSAIEHDLLVLQSQFNNQSITTPLKSGDVLEELNTLLERDKKKISVKSDFIYSLIHYFQQVYQSLLLMHTLLTNGATQKVPTYKVISKQQRLRSDYDLIKHSIKAGLSALLALGFWFVSNWPGGLNGIISSLILSIKAKNLFDMKHVGFHRLLGCFLGGGVALISLNIFEMNLFDLIIVLFASIWAFTYFMFKNTKYSYIGLQANIALIIALAQQGGPPVILDPPLQRLAGIIIGIVATFIVANVLWRSDVWSILNRYLNKLYKYLTFNLNQVLLVSAEQREIHELANLFWITRGLLESLGNENLSDKKKNRLNNLIPRFESLVSAQATISHILVAIDINKAHQSAELLQFDLALYEKQLVESYQKHAVEEGLALSQTFTTFLSDIENNPQYSKVKDSDLRNLLAYLNALKQLALRVQ